ncbi:MAG: helix-turn-helix transcriptional regulator [Clostridia bacterium]|nr:helix-turn-helix transcriptional regulator [Clostridia bacterium]
MGLTIKTLRKKNHLTQKNLAKRLNISETSVSKYESNTVTPPLDVLRSMSTVFHISMDEMFGTQPAGTISLHGLSENQKEIIKQLAYIFNSYGKNPTPFEVSEYYSILGRIVAEMFK